MAPPTSRVGGQPLAPAWVDVRDERVVPSLADVLTLAEFVLSCAS